jgi:Lipin/Ned1/Smp2 multi-domain protein middle domain
MTERIPLREQIARTSLSPSSLPEESTLSDLHSSSTEEVVFGLGGLLKSDPTDPHQFIIALDKTTMRFQLSLCGPMDGNDEVEDTRRFEYNRVSWRRFVANQQIAKHDELVILWGDKSV